MAFKEDIEDLNTLKGNIYYNFTRDLIDKLIDEGIVYFCGSQVTVDFLVKHGFKVTLCPNSKNKYRAEF